MSELISKKEFYIFVSEGGRFANGKEKEPGTVWTPQPEHRLHRGWYQALLVENGEDQVSLSNLTEGEINPGETGLAVVADERFNIYYVTSDGKRVQILGKCPDQQLDSRVVLRPLQLGRVPLIFPSQTTVNLVIAEGNQDLKLVQIMKV